MKATIYFCGGVEHVSMDTEILMEYLVGEKELELERIPNTGEVITISTHGVILEGKVVQVYTNIAEPHKNIKEEAWGVRYGLSIDEWDIVEYYDRNEVNVYKEKAMAWHNRYRMNYEE